MSVRMFKIVFMCWWRVIRDFAFFVFERVYLGCVEKHFFSRINLKLMENCPWVWTVNTLKYQ